MSTSSLSSSPPNSSSKNDNSNNNACPFTIMLKLQSDERDAIQKKTFTKWINKHLMKASKRVNDLFEDLKDGTRLIALLEVLSGESLPKEKGRMRLHHLRNVQIAICFLKYRNIKLVNIRPDDIVDGNPKLTLGLIWTIILHYQISDIIQRDDSITFQEALLRWAQRTTEGYPGVRVHDFTSSWRDGLAFNAIIHRNRPDLIDWRAVQNMTARERLEYMFSITERELGVTRILDPEDVDTTRPDEKSIITYVSMLYELFPEPNARNPLLDDEKLRRIEGYRDIAKRLIMWITETTERLKDRNWPNSVVEMRHLQSEHNRFRTEEIPARLHDKQRLAHAYREILKLAADMTTTVHIDHEISSDNIDILWDRMMIASQDRDQAIIEQMLRLEKLQRMAEKLLRDIKHSELRLDDIERAIHEEAQRVVRLDPRDNKFNIDGITMDLQVEGDKIDQLFDDWKILRDENYSKAGELGARIDLLHKRWSEIGFTFKTKVIEALERKRAELEAGIQENFNLRLSSIQDELARIESIVDSFRPPERELSLIQLQLKECKDTETKLTKVHHDLDLALRFFHDNPTLLRLNNSYPTLFDTMYKQISRLDGKLRSRSNLLQDTLARFIALTNMADKLLAAVKQSEQRLDVIEGKIHEEAQRVARLDPRDNKFNIEGIAADLKVEGDRIDSYFDEWKILRDENYPRGNEIGARIDALHKRWSNIRMQFQTKVVEALERRRMELEAGIQEKFNLRLSNIREELSRIEDTVGRFQPAEREVPLIERQMKEVRETEERLRKVHGDLDEAVRYCNENSTVLRETKSYRIEFDSMYKQITRLDGRLRQRLQDLDQALTNLKALIALADKLSKEIKICDSRLDDIERAIHEEANRVQRSDPRESKFNIDTIRNDLTVEGNRIDSIANEWKILRDENFSRSEEIGDRIHQLRKRWQEMDFTFKTKVIDALERRKAELDNIQGQFNVRLDGIKDELSRIEETIHRFDPPERDENAIQRQMKECKDTEDRLDKVHNQLDDAVRYSNDNSSLLRDFKSYRNEFDAMYKQISRLAHELKHRADQLRDALSRSKLSQKFFDDLDLVMKTLMELRSMLMDQEAPAAEPSAIQAQQQALTEIKCEIDQTAPEVAEVRRCGTDLMQMVDEPEKPEVRKQIEDLDDAWETITSLYAKREQNLIHAMDRAMNFHQMLQSILDFLDQAETRFDSLGPIASDIDSVKKQIIQLRLFKSDVDDHMVQIEQLNRQAAELMENTTPNQVRAIREPLEDINKRWDDLSRGIVDRNNELETALLRLGQFQHALDELLEWINKTTSVVRDMDPSLSDRQVIEMELAKLKVVTNDIEAHQRSVDGLNAAGKRFSSDSSSDSINTNRKLTDLNNKWNELRNLAQEKQRELERMLTECLGFNQRIQDLLAWLSDVDNQLASSKPVGGLPETAQEQLNKFLELYHEIESKKHQVESTLNQGNDIVAAAPEGSTSNLQHSLKQLKQRWDHILNRANDRKIKLGIALREATEFHDAMQEFIEWLSSAEKYLNNVAPVSRVLSNVTAQIEEHKTFQKDVAAHRDTMLALDKKGTHLKYFSQKQDVILIKNMMISVSNRWERIVSKTAERGRALEGGLRETREFFDSWTDMMNWLVEAETNLDSSISSLDQKSPDRIKIMLSKHKEFQRSLGAKQGTYDAIMKAGRTLKDKAPRNDQTVLQDMLNELRNKWSAVCNKSVDRQRKLEESLLFSGQFRDAVDALLDWLQKAKSQLDLDRLHGDLDTVTSLVEQHKSFQEDFKSRAKQLASVRRTASELLSSASAEDSSLIRQQLETLESRWEEVSKLSIEKSARLEEALRAAEKLHISVHGLLEWMSDAEMKLRSNDRLPGDEEEGRMMMMEHERFLKELASQEVKKESCIGLGEEILSKCHPEAIPTINHWIAIIKARWDEIVAWSRKREGTLKDELANLKGLTDLLDQLLNWIRRKENEIHSADSIPIPEDIPTIERLIDEHQRFIDDLASKQAEIESISRTFASKARSEAMVSTRSHSRTRFSSSRGTTTTTRTTSSSGSEGDIRNPRARELVDKYHYVWNLAMDRMRRLQEKLNYVNDLERMKNFDFEEWRRRFLAWLNNKKARVMDFYRKIDTDNDCRVTQSEFIQGFLRSKFPTSRLEMERVAPIFDRNNDGYIDHKEYLETLRASNLPQTEEEIILDEVQRQVAKCTCQTKYKVFHVGEGKYRFGESQKLRLVRILRSTVMVRVGGGWVSLDEFLLKNDPCRAKGRTNVELREQFILADGVSQSMTPFVSKMRSQGGRSETVSLPTQGPVTKIREKTERSIPMFGNGSGRRSEQTSDLSFEDSALTTDSPNGSKTRPRSRLTATTMGGSRPQSRSNSRGPTSRNNSRPASRANSDLSSESIEGYTQRKTTTRTTFSSTASGLRRTPSSGTNGFKERWK